ncbi:hypothetical protein DMUE_5982, partial [Dictyocoela muelleri]
MTNYYNNDIKFKQYIRNYLNLAFLKQDDLKDYFKILEKELKEFIYIGNIKEFHNYFKRMYIGSFDDLENPIYKISFWSVHDRILKYIPRTTNACEGFNRSLNMLMDIAHPNIAKFI